MGRPSKFSNSVVQKLTDSLKLGLSVQDSCIDAGISTSSYYTYKQNYPEFSDKMNYAQNYMKRKAKAVVLNAIESGDLATSRWFLQKYDHIEEEKPAESASNSLEDSKLAILSDALADLRAGIIRKEENRKKADEYRRIGLI